MGEWMKINGEAIYNTRRWKTPFQWSEGRRDYKIKNGESDIMLKLTLDPDPGYAVKEVFYTYNPATNILYAIFPKYPTNKRLILRNIDINNGNSKVSFLSTKEALSWTAEGDNTIIRLPEYDPNRITSSYAFAVKIENFGRYAGKPDIQVDYSSNSMKPIIKMNAGSGMKIYFTTDNSEPTKTSSVYAGPIMLDKSATIKAIAIQTLRRVEPPMQESIINSSVATENVKVYEWKKPQRISNPKSGVNYRYFEPTVKIDLNSLKGTATSSGVADIISIQNKSRTEKFAFEFSGYIKIDKDAIYTFFTDSDDGSMLYIDDEEIVNNDGDHGNVEKSGKAALKKGLHKIKVLYFDSGGGNSLKVSMQPEGGKKDIIPASLLFH
jgi:hypothetical protein